jgi:putative addiction module component (TIGR02574 family)
VGGEETGMTDDAKRLLPSLFALSEGDRLALIDALWDSILVPPGVWCEDDPGFKEELNRRLEEIKSGKVKGIPAEEVTRRMREKYP